MKRYTITVNGTAYDVTVDEADGSAAPVAAPAPKAAAPKKAVTCPYCGATTTPNASGQCEFCGGAV